MFRIPDNHRLLLASKSPRRRELMKAAGLKFDVVERNFDESYPGSLKGREIAEYLATAKAMQMTEEYTGSGTVIITADTIVWCNGEVLPKPANYGDAFRILKTISGKTHEVITGICLAKHGKHHTFSETTKVSFDILTDEEIHYYIVNHKPYDKAGAYGIQEWIGLIGNSSIEGSYFNVVGMPVNRLIRELVLFLK